MKKFSQAIAAAGHFSKSTRSGAPPVFSVNVERQTRVILSTDDVGHPPDNIDKQSNRIANKTLSNAGHYVADLLRGLVD
jgi:hypothetical protein